jgi:hypothetical protein
MSIIKSDDRLTLSRTVKNVAEEICTDGHLCEMIASAALIVTVFLTMGLALASI